MKQKGFTIIELLVVIAILGLLSSVVLTQMNKPKDSAKDAVIISEMGQIKNLAELIGTQVQDFTSLCCNVASCDINTLNETHPIHGTDLMALESDIRKQQDGTLDLICVADNNHYCITADLSVGGYFCADNSGYAGIQEDPGCDIIGPDYTCATP